MGYGGEGGFVEVGGDGVAVDVAFIAYALVAAVFGDGCPLGKTHADGANQDAFGGGFAGGGLGVVFEVLAVGDDDDGAALVLDPFTVGVAVAEGLHGFLDGVADGGALGADELAVDLVEEELYGAVVVGEGHLHIAATGKHH